MTREEGLSRLEALGFRHGDAEMLWEHFDDAERRGKKGHGYSRIPWLERLEGFDPAARPVERVESDGYWRWHANGTIGYLALRRAAHACGERPPGQARLQPGGDAARLLPPARRQLSRRIGAAVLGFGVSPQNQIHRRAFSRSAPVGLTRPD